MHKLKLKMSCISIALDIINRAKRSYERLRKIFCSSEKISDFNENIDIIYLPTRSLLLKIIKIICNNVNIRI